MAEQIVSQRRFGDQVEITGESIALDLPSPGAREINRHLELKGVRFLRLPTGQERLMELASRAWREKGNLLKDLPVRCSPAVRPPAALAADGYLQHAQQVNLEYVAKLPNFVVDETALHYTRETATSEWQFVYSAESELTVRGLTAIHEHVIKDGRPWPQPFEALPGVPWKSKFGT
ncbi:MAG: hypothetical protein JOZ32_11610, partial [Bryobacterales bacterium]|nr:hypothetical protein [Bryobacterales bacterium]